MMEELLDVFHHSHQLPLRLQDLPILYKRLFLGGRRFSSLIVLTVAIAILLLVPSLSHCGLMSVVSCSLLCHTVLIWWTSFFIFFWSLNFGGWIDHLSYCYSFVWCPVYYSAFYRLFIYVGFFYFLLSLKCWNYYWSIIKSEFISWIFCIWYHQYLVCEWSWRVDNTCTLYHLIIRPYLLEFLVTIYW